MSVCVCLCARECVFALPRWEGRLPPWFPTLGAVPGVLVFRPLYPLSPTLKAFPGALIPSFSKAERAIPSLSSKGSNAGCVSLLCCHEFRFSAVTKGARTEEAAYDVQMR